MITISQSEYLASVVHDKLPNLSRNEIMGVAFQLPYEKFRNILTSLDKPNLREVIKKELNI